MYRCKIANTPELLDKLFKFRYEIASTTLEGFKKNSKKRDIDVYDDYSIHFIALDEDDKICAATRFIVNSPIGYPTENYMEFELDDKIANNRDKLSEISRIFIAKEARGVKSSKFIIDSFIDLIYIYIKKYQIEYIYGALEKNFLRFLHMIHIDYQIIGEGANYYGFRYPCILKSSDLVKDNPRLLNIK